jgi:hypothetical protein
MSTMALLLFPDGHARDVQPKDGRSLSLDEMHALLPDAQALDFVYGQDGTALVVDDLGLRKNLPINEKATRIYQAWGGVTPIYGPALYCRLHAPGEENERWT